MSLTAFLGSLALSNYQAVFSNKGFTDLDQFLCLSDADLDAALTSLAMLKGHAFKFKKALEALKKGETPPVKRPCVEGDLGNAQLPSKPMMPKPGFALQSVKPAKPVNSLVLEVEKLMSKLREIESVKEDISRVRGLILAVDLDRYRRGLEQVEDIQKSMKDMEVEDAVGGDVQD